MWSLDFGLPTLHPTLEIGVGHPQVVLCRGDIGPLTGFQFAWPP